MLTKEQVKGKIKNIAKNNKADARILLRMYMMERFLERVAVSSHSVSNDDTYRDGCAAVAGISEKNNRQGVL